MDVLDKAMKLGFDLLSVGQNRMDAISKELQNKYGLNEKQAKNLANDLVKHAKATHKETMKVVDDNLKGVIDKKDLTDIKKTIGSCLPSVSITAVKKKAPTRKKPTKKKPTRRKKK